MDIEAIGTQIVDAAYKIHSTLGPGLLESVYQKCLIHELRKRGLQIECEVVVPIIYEGLMIESAYRIDILVENCVIIENKTVETLLPVHEAQILTYMKLRKCSLGYLINWNVNLIKHGIKRKVL